MALNLIQGVPLEILHPEIPTCGDCKAWLYGKDWKRSQRGGVEQARPAGSPTPCHTCPKSHDGKPHPEKELLPENRAAVEYFHLCQADATGLIPRDLVVVQNNALVARVYDQVNRNRSDLTLLTAMMGGKK